MTSLIDRKNSADIWLRRDWILTAIFIISTVSSLLIVLLRSGSEQTVEAMLIQVAIVTVLITLHPFVMHLYLPQYACHASQSRAYSAILLGYTLIALTLWFILTSFELTYLFMLIGLFPLLNRYHVPKVAIPLNVLVAGLWLVGVSGGSWNRLPTLKTETILWFLLLTLSALMMRGWISAIIKQSLERRELIEQLSQVRRELLQAERRTGILEERQRLAREIHDTLAQGFTSIVMNLEAAEQNAGQLNPTAQTYFDRARLTARESLEQSRRVISDLRPQPLEDHSFPDAIRRVVDNWATAGDVAANSTITGTPLPLSKEAELTLLRAVQESLNNVRKHADANAVNVTLSYMGDMVMLDVQDNGVGLQQSEKSNRYGLSAMRERIAAINGSFDIESTPNEGTTIVVTLPI